MRIADRYIGWQVIYGTLFGVTLLTVVLVLGQLFKQIHPLLVEQRLPLWMIGKFVLTSLPFSLMFTIPWGFLAATLLTFGRLSAHNELLGLRMAGVGLARVALPVLAAGALFSGLCVWLTGTAAPAAKAASRTLLYDAVRRDPESLLDPGVVQSRFKEQRVYVERREGGLLRGLHIYLLSDDTRDAAPLAYVYARTINLRVNPELKELRLRLRNAYIETVSDDGSVELAFAGEAEPWLIDFSASAKKNVEPSDLTNHSIPAAIAARREEEARHARRLANPSLSPEKRAALERARAKARHTRKQLRLELQKRYSLSAACLAFGMIGVPLGVTTRRRETSAGLLISLLIAAAYFGGMIVANQALESHSSAGAALLWTPNAVCLALGAWLFHRASHR